ncbi:diaminobutyrate--2-oxoglutarate transaminase [uncultured Prevotella sp.]|uniref:diaminobutyrate--2-oxoglutarate transaminase n=1 Tax=uncultured Prevotella sp. TaxID=159272 RepID=UPI002590CF09|nr:diaminobutyrate--2-oxoglutarate transaminase [uncultured Prevotella sp.]
MEKYSSVFGEVESQVRSYCRKFPVEFSKAHNSELFAKDGTRYIDFLDVAGSMNYGHNNPYIKKAIMDYLAEDTIINALDLYTEAKAAFLETMEKQILEPRNLDYKVMCCGPTGTNAIEAALKLARKNKKRTNIFAFSGAFHGMSLGSLAMTTDQTSREGAGVPLNNVTFVPYENKRVDSIEYIRHTLEDDHSGVAIPAAIFVETTQAEGGINVSSVDFLRELRAICDEYDILLVVDDIQVGNGRTGYFFSFERAGIVPDMVVLSKSISGFGMPMSLLLMKPELDIFRPAEHNGTFRGNQLSFVGGKAGIEFFNEHHIGEEVQRKAKIIDEFMKNEIIPIDSRLAYRGIGMIWGIDFMKIDAKKALDCSHACFDKGLIIELAGRHDSVLKLMPALTIEDEVLMEGLEIIKVSVIEVLK